MRTQYWLFSFFHVLSVLTKAIERKSECGNRTIYNGRNLMSVNDMVSIPITLEQLITAVQQLQPDERAQVARALIQVDLRSDLTALIQELYAQPVIDDITDDDINAEVKAVRQHSQQV